MPVIDVRKEARALRFITSARRIEKFAARHAHEFSLYTLFGSGDFHHLSAVWTRQFHEPFILLSLDNHPDWDIRPPKWSCGAWINRALENPRVQEVDIWGCGNFECNFPWRLLGNGSAAREGRLQVHPWEQAGVKYPAWLNPLTSETWKSQFAGWVDSQADQRVYITIDMDCLSSDEAATNWENGRFTSDDLVWALHALREKMEVIGGDLCGAWSFPKYQTTFQKLAGWFDHPRVQPPSQDDLLHRNLRVFQQLWPALTGTGANEFPL
jgi:arginase family enzyme